MWPTAGVPTSSTPKARGRSSRPSAGPRHFDGAASFDEITFPTKGFAGLTLRLYHPATEQWSLYWASKRTGTLFPPVTGRFTGRTAGPSAGRVGEFYGDDVHNGTPIRARFIWSGITAEAAHWEQAFSADDGRTWVTNWHMDLTRRPGQ